MAQYEILRSLDRGGMAEVSLARLVGVEGFEKRVVLKRVLPHLSSDPRFLQRFVDEARVAARLSHPNIVQIFELGEQHGQYFIAMEHVDGRNLKDVAKKLHGRGERVPVEHAVRVGAAVLDALHYAHTRTDDVGKPVGLVHRDVSPANVLVSFEGVVKLIDFGIARTVDRIELTQPGSVVGKAGYMSPEQMRGEPVDARTDVFALAATLFHVVTGVLPYPGTGAANVMHAVNHGQRRPHAEVKEVLDDELFGILSKGFAHELEARFQSARAMQAALERYASGRGFLPGTAALGDMMRQVFRAGDDDDRDEKEAADPETQSRVITLGQSAFTATATVGQKPQPTLAVTLPDEPAVRGRSAMALLTAVTVTAALGGALAFGLTRQGADDVTVTRSAIASEGPVAIVAARDGGEGVASSSRTDAGERDAGPPMQEMKGSAAAGPSTSDKPDEAVQEEADRVPPQAPQKSRRTERALERRAATASGTLTLDSEPWSEVTVNGRRVGLTPLHALELPAGRHRIVLRNADEGREKRMTLTLRAGEQKRLRVRLP